MRGLAAINLEERCEPRDEVLLRARATWEDGRPLVLTIVNLSWGGLMARCGTAAVPGDRLTVELPPIGQVGVEVRWALGGRIGCRFDVAVKAERYAEVLAAARAAS